MESRTAGEIELSTQKLLSDLRAVVHDGEELLKAGAHDLSEKGAAAKERLKAALEAARETEQKLKDRAVEGAKAADKVIREHPYQSIGIAFGIGILVGVLVSRK